MSRRQRPKGGFRSVLPWHVRREQAEALNRLAAILERLEADGSLSRGGSGGAADTPPHGDRPAPA